MGSRDSLDVQDSPSRAPTTASLQELLTRSLRAGWAPCARSPRSAPYVLIGKDMLQLLTDAEVINIRGAPRRTRVNSRWLSLRRALQMFSRMAHFEAQRTARHLQSTSVLCARSVFGFRRNGISPPRCRCTANGTLGFASVRPVLNTCGRETPLPILWILRLRAERLPQGPKGQALRPLGPTGRATPSKIQIGI